MNSMMLDRMIAESRLRGMLRRICEQGMREPAGIWERLECEGIHVTPGVIYQAVTDLVNQQATSDQDDSQKALRERENGVSLKDLATLVLLAEKAGGVGRLIRLLRTVQQASSAQPPPRA